MKVLFRAKEKNTDNHIIGYEYYNHIEDEWYITHYITGNNYKVDKSTRSINFEDMFDSQGNKIFASLSEDGRGSDITETKDGWNIYKRIHLFSPDGLREIKNIGIIESLNKLCRTSLDIKVIGIQE